MGEKAGEPPAMKDLYSLTDIFRIEKLQHLQDLFSDATGLASVIIHHDGIPITRPSNNTRLFEEIIRKNGIQNITGCFPEIIPVVIPPDGPMIRQSMGGSLWEACTALSLGGRSLGFWIIGQVRTPFADREKLSQCADETGIGRDTFIDLFEEIMDMTEEKFRKNAHILHAYAGEISSWVEQNLQLEQQVHARQIAEEQISMLAMALKSISECICISDLDDNITFVNESFLKTYGYTSEELLGKPVQTVRSENNKPLLIAEIFPETLRGGWKGELINKRRDGTEFPVFISTSPVRDDLGKPIALMGVATDITENKLIEAALRESETKYKSLFNGARDAIFIMNNTCFLDCNKSTCEIFGVTPDQIIGSSPSDFSPLYQPDGQLSSVKARNYLDEALAGTPLLFEWDHTRLDGTVFHAEVGLNRIMLKGNWYLQAIVRDMTKRKQVEKALKDKANELERFNRLLIGRELKMTELKKEINELLMAAGKPEKYRIHD